MSRMYLKELREKRWWAFAMLVAGVAPVLFGSAYTVLGQIGAYSAWMWAPISVALLFGMTSFSSEVSRGTAHFLYSRPVSWKTVIVSKVLVGLSSLIVSALASVLVYRLIKPAQYVEFTTALDLLRGLAYGLLMTGAGYLAGVACSVVLPGIFGGIIVILAASVIGGLEQWAANALTGAYWSYWFQLWMIGWPIGVAVAAVVVSRFGVTLPTRHRILRCAAITAVFVFLAAIANVLYPKPLVPMTDFRSSHFSPDGRYALITQMQIMTDDKERAAILRLSDRRIVQIGEFEFLVTSSPRWTNSGALYLYVADHILFLWMDRDGRLVRRSVPLPAGKYARPKPSPDGRMAMVPGSHEIRFVDLDRFRPVELTIKSPKRWWWQSPTSVGYIDTHGKRHIVQVKQEGR